VSVAANSHAPLTSAEQGFLHELAQFINANAKSGNGAAIA
jgi:hypothetical protein